MSEMSRRRFLAATAAGASTVAASPSAVPAGEAARYAVDDQVAFGGQTRRLKLTNGGRCIACLIFPTDYPTHFRLKPELYPVCTPKGIPVTDSHQYCFIHHQSIMTGHGKVRVDGSSHDVDFYRQLPYPDPHREDKFHKGHNLFQMGPSGIQKITGATWSVTDRVTLQLTLEWQSRQKRSEGGAAIVREARQYEVFQQGPLTVIDQFSQLRPAGKSVTLKEDRHSFVGVRVHDLIDPDEGGVMRDSEGRVNPDGNYGDDQGSRKAPKWMDCTGRIGEDLVGIALMGHPGNIRNEFYCRSYGVMICSAALGHDVRVTRDQPFRFAARFVAHDGPLAGEKAEAIYEEFSRRKQPQLDQWARPVP